MTQTNLIPTAAIPKVRLLPPNADKDTRSRLHRFERWLNRERVPWYEPDLSRYRDALLEDLAPSSVVAHLSSIRASYGRLLKSNAMRDVLELAVREALQASSQPADIANTEAAVVRLLVRMANAVDPLHSRVKVRVSQDAPDDTHLRLTARQARALMDAPDARTLRGKRDRAIIGLMLCTGIRAAELIALDVEDLKQHLDGKLALHVRRGKGIKERLIPYGELGWIVPIVQKWLKAAHISEGALFRPVWKNGKGLRPGRLSLCGLAYVLGRYPIRVNGAKVRVRPHDLRRTYARRLYDGGTDLLSVSQNLGHKHVSTTQGYIGILDADMRCPAEVYKKGGGR